MDDLGLVCRLKYLDLDTDGVSYACGLTDKAVREYGGKPFDEHSVRTLDHELEISYFHIALQQFSDHHGLELRWQQSGLKTKTIHPDAYFTITNPGKEGRNTNHFFLEIERSKVGNVKDGQPSIVRKLINYYAYYNSAPCQAEWGIATFRVIIQVANETRAANLLRAFGAEYRHRMFWIAAASANLRFRTPRDFGERAYSLLDI